MFRRDDLDDFVDGLERTSAKRDGLVNMGRRSYELVEIEQAPRRDAELIVRMATPKVGNGG